MHLMHPIHQMCRPWAVCACGVGALLVLACGCSKQPAPPAPVSAEEAPQTLQQVFKPEATPGKKTQDPEVRRLVNEAAEYLQARDYGRAIFSLQALSMRSDLTAEQRDYATRAMATAQQQLEQAAAAGNAQAREALDYRRRTK